MNDVDLFHQATLRICSSLDLGEVAQQCLDFFRDIFPLEGIMMNRYDSATKELIILALRTTLRVPSDIKSISIPADGQVAFDSSSRRIAVMNRPEDNPVTQAIWGALGQKTISSLVLYLWFKGSRIGQVELFARGQARFTSEHARLLELLHDPFAVVVANTIQHREVLHLKEMLADDNRLLRQALKRASTVEMIGADGGLKNVMEAVDQVAPLNSHVLLLGETGVGKEIVANAIHFQSPRKEGPFVKINCGAIPESLIDSELFGHEKGAFTGALARKVGRFERAHRGTIFLDEVGDLPPAVQVRLLRVLQEKEIERVGGIKPVKVDVRIIAATNKDLEMLVRQGKFREDIWFRLNVFPILIPPLRQRKSDIPELIHHFIVRKSREMNFNVIPTLAQGAIERLCAYDWPGNVRELENIVERALIRMRTSQRGKPLVFEELSGARLSSDGAKINSAPENPLWALDQTMKNHILAALEKTAGRIHGPRGAAKLLGLNPSTLRNRMRRLGIPFAKSDKET